MEDACTKDCGFLKGEVLNYISDKNEFVKVRPFGSSELYSIRKNLVKLIDKAVELREEYGCKFLAR